MPYGDDDALIGLGPDGEAYPVAAPPSVDLGRARGALLGLAVGDAYGTTLEFSTPAGLPPFPELAAGPHREVTGGGPFRLVAGQVTDDTQMACCLAASLMANGQLEPADLGRRYVAWRKVAFDIGTQTAASLGLLASGVEPLEAGRRVWVEGGRKAAGNGSLMRTVPIGVFAADLPHNRRIQSLLDSQITHWDPRCQLACAAYNAAVSVALQDGADAAGMHAAAVAELDAAAALLHDLAPEEAAATEAARVVLLKDLVAAAVDDPELYGPELHIHRHAGFVRVAFRLAFWELAHAPSYEAALVDVVNRGGDADTNGAIAGGLLGVRYGAAAIPERWSRIVLAALANRPASDPFSSLYHPRNLLALVRAE